MIIFYSNYHQRSKRGVSSVVTEQPKGIKNNLARDISSMDVTGVLTVLDSPADISYFGWFFNV